MRVSSINSNYYNSFAGVNKGIRPASFENEISFQSNTLRNLPKTKSFLNKTKDWAKIAAFILSLNLFCYMQNKNLYNSDVKCVQSEQTEFNTREAALDYAFDKITEPLNSPKPYEYGVIIDYNTNKVLSENIGNDTAVLVYNFALHLKNYLNIEQPYISLHGHPQSVIMPGRIVTTSFSFQDFISFNKSKNEKISYVVNKDGQYCLFRKKDNYKKLSKKELAKIEEEFLTRFKTSYANKIEVIKDNEVINTFYDQQGVHAFWKELGDKYNFEYYTTYGIFDGVDAYLDFYYPHKDFPEVPSGHRNFKK